MICSIIDLDNCISDDKWRWGLFDLHHEDSNKKYERYHRACGGDELRNLGIVRHLASRTSLIVFTARPESVRFITQAKLREAGILPQLMFMRPEGNTLSSVELKQCFLHFCRDSGGMHFSHAIDDREDILTMYRREGIRNVQQVIIHPEGAPTHDVVR